MNSFYRYACFRYSLLCSDIWMNYYIPNMLKLVTPSASEIYYRQMFSKHADWENELKAKVYDLY